MRIALVAHEKRDILLNGAERHLDGLRPHSLIATASTAALLGARFGLSVSPVQSGPLGGDQQLGAMIAEGRLNVLIFFSDSLAAQPHDADVRALLRVAVLHNVPTATNPATADAVFASLVPSARTFPEQVGPVAHSVVTEGEACPPAHLTCDPLGCGVDAIGEAVAVRECERGDHCVAVSLQAPGEGLQTGQIGCADLGRPKHLTHRQPPKDFRNRPPGRLRQSDPDRAQQVGTPRRLRPRICPPARQRCRCRAPDSQSQCARPTQRAVQQGRPLHGPGVQGNREHA